MKITFFTTCMGRLNQLRQTLPKNIEDNKDYVDCNFLVLDYNSSDGLEKWIKTEMGSFIKSGKILYHKTNKPKFFWHNHAKNVAARLTPEDSDIICSLDADNFSAKNKKKVGLAKKLNQIFQSNQPEKIFVRACGWDYDPAFYSCSGKIATLRKDFMEVRGFNENLKGHYFDEEEFWRRLENVGKYKHIRLDPEYSKAIPNTNYERLVNLDPALISPEYLATLRERVPEFTEKEYMIDPEVMRFYPQGIKNRDITQTVLKNKILIPNPSIWGALEL